MNVSSFTYVILMIVSHFIRNPQLAMDPVKAECAMIKAACKGIGSHAQLVSYLTF